MPVINVYDILYGAGLGIAWPFWLLKGSARRKVFEALSNRLGKDLPPREGSGDAVMIHAVSLGEINATRSLISSLRSVRPELRLIVSATTTAGHARAVQLYGNEPGITVIRFPLDFTGAVSRVLDGLRPSIVVLMELEVWPNFLHQCARRGIPVVVANGRLTLHSYRGYRRLGFLSRRMFGQLASACVQDETYAERFRGVGVDASRVHVVGTVKFDTANVADRIPGDDALARDIVFSRDRETLWVCGSTGPGEEEIVLRIFRALRERFPTLRLAIVPRKLDRFDDVARRIEQSGERVLRRSQTKLPPGAATIAHDSGARPPIILGDTTGELTTFYSLADVIFVGRTLVDLGASQHGSDMIEAAALGKAVVVGPFTANFDVAMRQFRAKGAMIEVATERELLDATATLLGDPNNRASRGALAREVVLQGKGATGRHVAEILRVLDSAPLHDPGKSLGAS